MSSSEPGRSRPQLVWSIVVGLIGAGLVAGGIVALSGNGSGNDSDSGSDQDGDAVTEVAADVGASATPDVTTSTLTSSADATALAQRLNDDGSVVVVTVPAPITQCPAATKTVSTAEQLQAALDTAEPGDSIGLADGTYVGEFVTTASGTEAQPIFLCGGRAAVLDGDSTSGGYVLHMNGAQWWRVVGFTVRNGQKGVVADGVTQSIIQGLTVEQIGDEAIHLRSFSTYNSVLGNTIRQTGLRRDKFGEGIYVGSATSNWPNYSGGEPDRSDYNLVQGNNISATSSEAIDIKEGTTGGRVIGNTMDGTGMTGADSLVDVKGNDWLIEGNVAVHAVEAMQTHRILDGWGMRNTFTRNTVDVDGDGNHFYIHDPDITQNVVKCDNRTGSGVPLTSNVACVA